MGIAVKTCQNIRCATKPDAMITMCWILKLWERGEHHFCCQLQIGPSWVGMGSVITVLQDGPQQFDIFQPKYNDPVLNSFHVNCGHKSPRCILITETKIRTATFVSVVRVVSGSAPKKRQSSHENNALLMHCYVSSRVCWRGGELSRLQKLYSRNDHTKAEPNGILKGHVFAWKCSS